VPFYELFSEVKDIFQSDFSSLSTVTVSQLAMASEEVLKLLEREAQWDFNIIELELLTKKRSVVFIRGSVIGLTLASRSASILGYQHVEIEV